MDPIETARRIARNEISEFDIDWRAYQRLVWWLISQETKIQAEPTYRSEIRHEEDAGVIDILVRLTGPPIKLFGDDSLREDLQIFIECKQYRATLTLDKVGKVFCHSILEQPDALWIVSPRRLSAQANDYAKKIFRTNDPTARVPFLRRTQFRHWQLRELIDGRISDQSVEFHIADWQIVQFTPFGTAVVASASTSRRSRKRSVYSDGRGLFHVRLFVDGFSGATARVELAFECSELKNGLIPLRNCELRGTDEIAADISSIDISGRQITGILIKDPHLGTEQRIEIGRLAFQSFDPLLFELRPLTAATIANQISQQLKDRVACLSGPAGVGKSTLLDQVAWKLGREHGWDVRAHTVSENTDYSLLYDLMEWFALAVAPLNFIEVNTDVHDDVRRSIIATIAYRHSGLQTPDAVQNLVEAAARGAVNEAQIQQLARILVRIAKTRETPLLVVLRDMHSASPAVQKALLQLFLRLRDEGWGNVRFLIEARRDHNSTGLTGLEYISSVAEQLGQDFRAIDVRPLTLEELHAALRPHFRSPNFDETTRQLHHLTAGYPLLVDQLLRDLLVRAVIIKIGTKPDRYAIDSNALKGLRLERVAPQLELFLRGRIERASLSTNEGIMAASLGIIAQTLRVTPEGVPKSLVVDLIAAGLGATGEQVDECLDLLTSLNFLRPEDAGRAVGFAHEATRSTAADFARSNIGFLRVVRRIANSNVLPQILGRFRSDLLQAYLALEIGQAGEAVRLALSAEASVAETGNLIQRRLALECAVDALSKNDRPDAAWARNELAVRERLVWTVMQQASQHFARMAIESSEQRISSMHGTGLISSSERSAAAFHCARCRVVIGTRGLDAPALLEALPMMCASALDPVQIHYALTRLILVAMEIDDIASACRAIEYCLRLPVLKQHLPLNVCENGFIAVNPPLTGSRIGSLSTRTAHPYFLAQFQDILDAAGIGVRIHTPYATMTKGEMLRACADQPLLRALAASSTSCGRFQRYNYRHCGRCVPCQVRRAAFLAWGQPDPTQYVFELLGRDDPDHAGFDDVRSVGMALAAVKEGGFDGWLGSALSWPRLDEGAELKDMLRRGLAELGALHAKYGVQ